MKILSSWRSVKLWESAFERDLHRRHSLRTHGMLIGSCTLLLMWGVSALLMHTGEQSLALRYLVTLGTGYVGYLLLIRLWAQHVVEQRGDGGDLSGDWGDGGIGSGHGSAPSHDLSPGGGGDFAGGGASGGFDDPAIDVTTDAASERAWANWQAAPLKRQPAPKKAPSSSCPWSLSS